MDKKLSWVDYGALFVLVCIPSAVLDAIREERWALGGIWTVMFLDIAWILVVRHADALRVSRIRSIKLSGPQEIVASLVLTAVLAVLSLIGFRWPWGLIPALAMAAIEGWYLVSVLRKRHSTGS